MKFKESRLLSIQDSLPSIFGGRTCDCLARTFSGADFSRFAVCELGSLCGSVRPSPIDVAPRNDPLELLSGTPSGEVRYCRRKSQAGGTSCFVSSSNHLVWDLNAS